MKNILYIALSLLLVSVSACSEPDYQKDLEPLGLLRSNTRFTYAGGTGEIVVDTNETVTAVLDESGEGWCEISVAKNVVTVNVNEHSATGSRHTFVTLSVKDGRKTQLAISQTSFYLNVPEELTINCLSSQSTLAGDRYISYSPKNLTTIEAIEDVQWIRSATVNTAEGTVTIDAEVNQGAARDGIVKVIAGTQEREVIVTQQAVAVVTSSDPINLAKNGAATVIDFEVPGGAGLTSATSDASWCTVTYDNTAKTITVSATNYTGSFGRNTTLTLTSGSITTTVNVSQR